MKYILLFSLVIFTLFACSKNDQYSKEEDRIEGFWKLKEVTGGIAGTGYEANFDHLQINQGETYALMLHDSYIQEGTYELIPDDNQLLISFTPNLPDSVFFDDQVKTVMFSEQNNKLSLIDPCCDLFVYNFEKE